MTTSDGNTQVSDTDSSTAALAARRRGRKPVPGKTMADAMASAQPGTAAAPTIDDPATLPPVEPVAVPTPVTVIADRATVAAVTERVLPAPAGSSGWTDGPLVAEYAPAGVGQVLPADLDYVIADCDADEQIRPPGCTTPVARRLWTAGQRVRRDLYDAVMAAQNPPTPDAPVVVPVVGDVIPPAVV